MKRNAKELMLVPAKRAQMLWSAITAQFIVVVMLLCLYHAVRINEEGKYTPQICDNFWLFLVKFPAMYALHFSLSTGVNNGMSIMKFANQ